MQIVEHKGVKYAVSDDFFLTNFPEKLDENWIDFVLSAEGVEKITNEQRKIVTDMWKFYKENGMPKMKDVVRITGCPLKRLYDIFPDRGPQTVAKMAGLPEKIC